MADVVDSDKARKSFQSGLILEDPSSLFDNRRSGKTTELTVALRPPAKSVITFRSDNNDFVETSAKLKQKVRPF